MCRALRHILKTWFKSIFRHVDYVFPKNFKINTFPIYFEIVIPIDGDSDGTILSSSRLKSIGSRSDRFKAEGEGVRVSLKRNLLKEKA